MLPVPKPGEIVRYAYLWRSEHEAGLEEGRKDRPCAVVLSLLNRATEVRLIVLPITHTPPVGGLNAIEIPPDTKRRLGLDAGRSWIILDEANRFTWPGPDIRPFDGPHGRTVSYGYLPPGLFKIVRDRFLALDAARNNEPIERTE